MHGMRAAACAVILVSAPGLARALDGFYAGAAIGVNHASSDYAAQVVNARTSDPAPPTDVSLDEDRRSVGRIFAGVKIAPSWAVEVDYADLGSLKTHAMWHGLEPIFQFERFGKIDVRAATLSIVGSAPITAALDIFARAGAAYTWVDYQTVGTAFTRQCRTCDASGFPSPTPPKLTGNGTRAMVALGLGHRLTDRWSVRAEYARYFDLGKDYRIIGERGRFDLDAATLGVAYRF